MEKRCSFELFKSNVCHRLKEQGDIDFLIETLKEDMIRQYYDKKWYPEKDYHTMYISEIIKVLVKE